MLASTQTGDGIPLVLLHAFPFSRQMWRPQHEIPNVRLITPDLPGFGESPVVESTVDSMADAVAELLDGLQISTCLLGGCSMGGYVALAFARRHLARLQGLILIDTKAEPDDATAKANRTAMINSAATLTAESVIDGMIPKALCEETRSTRPDVVAEVRRIGAAQSVAGIVAAQTMMRDRPDSRPLLATLQLPTLVVVGEHDSITPPTIMQGMADSIRGSRFVRIPSAGHLPNLESPGKFNAAVREWIKARVVWNPN